MNEVVSLLLAFGCGVFVGFIVAAVFAVGARADDEQDFDGGWRASNEPRVMTRIWSSDVINKEEK